MKTKTTSITQGPWVATDDGRYVVNGDGVLIADCYADSYLEYGLPDRPEYQANAKAIAALPKLIAALQESRNFIKALLDDSADEATDLLTNSGGDVEERASEALAKAGV